MKKNLIIGGIVSILILSGVFAYFKFYKVKPTPTKEKTKIQSQKVDKKIDKKEEQKTKNNEADKLKKEQEKIAIDIASTYLKGAYTLDYKTFNRKQFDAYENLCTEEVKFGHFNNGQSYEFLESKVKFLNLAIECKKIDETNIEFHKNNIVQVRLKAKYKLLNTNDDVDKKDIGKEFNKNVLFEIDTNTKKINAIKED